MYAFTKENVKRWEEVVAMLMNLMHQKLEVLIDKERMVTKYGIQLQILAELSLLPQCSARVFFPSALRERQRKSW